MVRKIGIKLLKELVSSVLHWTIRSLLRRTKLFQRGLLNSGGESSKARQPLLGVHAMVEETLASFDRDSVVGNPIWKKI